MTDKIFISQKEAKRQFRAAGLSVKAAAAAVEKLRKFTDGKREKVKSVDVRRVIREQSEPSPLPVNPSAKPIRPIKWKPETLAYDRY